MILKSELLSTVSEVLDEELEGTLSPKAREDLAETLVDRICVEHEVLDDEDEETDEDEL